MKIGTLRGRLRATVLAGATVMLAASPVQAQVSVLTTQEEDGQCLALMSILAGNENAQLKQAGMMGALYFVGKMSAREPGMELKAAMTKAADELGTTDRQAMLQTCLGEMKAQGENMQAVGKALKGE